MDPRTDRDCRHISRGGCRKAAACSVSLLIRRGSAAHPTRRNLRQLQPVAHLKTATITPRAKGSNGTEYVSVVQDTHHPSPRSLPRVFVRPRTAQTDLRAPAEECWPPPRLRGPEEESSEPRRGCTADINQRLPSLLPVTSPPTHRVYETDGGFLGLINLECANKARTVNSLSSLETQY